MKIKWAIHVTNWPLNSIQVYQTFVLCKGGSSFQFMRTTGFTKRAQINTVIKYSCCLVLPLMIWLSFPVRRFISYNNDSMCSWASSSGPLDAIWLITGFLSVSYFSSLSVLTFLIRSIEHFRLEWFKTTGVYLLICLRYLDM